MDSINLQMGTFILGLIASVSLTIIGFFIRSYMKRSEKTTDLLFEKLGIVREKSNDNENKIKLVNGRLDHHRERLNGIEKIQTVDHETLIGLKRR